MEQCRKCLNHSIKEGRDYCNNRIVKTLKGELCYCDVPCEDAINTRYCSFVNRPKSAALKKEVC